jgi:hypothetical protein
MAQYDGENSANGAVIVFRDDLTHEECEQAIRQIGRYIKTVNDPGLLVVEYDPHYGGPVWYVP